jgi:hypothetical protein
MNKDVVKMLLDSDCEVLAKAYESDGELLEMINKIITQHISSIYDVLIKKGVLTEEEAITVIKSVNKRLQEKGGKENGKT